MTIRWTLACLLCLAALGARRPNVVLIITDDQGYGDLACHGNAMIRTPNLDRLHGESVRFTNFHVDPTCAPTRAALMTGRYSARTGVWHTIMGRSLLRHDEKTMPEVLAGAGYRTGIFGKWHLGDNYPMRPQDRGFSRSLVHFGGGITQTPDFWGNSYFDPTLWHDGKAEKFEGYCTDVFFSAAERFIEQSKGEPFFAYIATNAPHSPFQVDDRYSGPYRAKGVEKTMADFYGMITNIDENVGRLTKRLKELGLEEDTILIFMTDNGTAAGMKPANANLPWRGFNAGMRGTKSTEYEGGHRVPLFVRYPAKKIGGGRDVRRLAAHFDLLPTLVELCGIEKPAVKWDGASLVPLLEGEDGAWPERTLVVENQRVERPVKWRKTAVMTDRWRLVNNAELYDVTADPGQASNVAGAHPAVVAELRAKYESWWEEMSPAHEGHVRIVVGSERENPATITCHDWHAGSDGEVPWSQQQVRAGPNVNGYWMIEVEKAGRYRVTLRTQPAAAEKPIGLTQARVKVDGVEREQAVSGEATAAIFELPLAAGPARLETAFSDGKTGKTRGAFFVEIERLP